MVLPLYAALDRLDKSLIEASLDLGAGISAHCSRSWCRWRLPGIISGIIITFVPALGAYLTPDLLGGPDSQMIANVIERQFKKANDWPFGAALSFLLMYATFAAIALRAYFSRGKPADGHGISHGPATRPPRIQSHVADATLAVRPSSSSFMRRWSR
jgi:spermidine/putrescine transport system permease protein